MGAPLDLRIDGGTIMDGSGQPGVQGSVGVRDGKIVAVGEVSGNARERIDARGMIVAPGFIDVHTHYDAQAFWDPTLSPSSRFGVTTVIAGNCGFSIAPLSGKADDTEYLMRMLARVEGMPLEALRAGVPWNWRSFEEYLARIDGTLAINAGFMVGHSAMRRAVMGSRAIGQAATAAELSQMQALLRTSLAAGGMGLSTTMSNSHLDGDGNPVPSRFATREEMIGLAGILAEFEGTTLEFEPTVASEFSEDLVKLMTDMSLAAGRLLNWNTLLPDSRMPNLYRSHLAASDYAAARGARIVPLVAAQQNTLTVNFISAFILASYPGWGETMRLPLDARKKALMDPAIRRKLDEGAHSPESGHGALTSDWPKWVFAQIHHPDNKHWEGKKVGEVAESLGKAPFDVLLDVVVADDLKTLLVMPQRGATEESWEMLGVGWKEMSTPSAGGGRPPMVMFSTLCASKAGRKVRRNNSIR